ncbi:MAG: hypothetical protein Q7T44_03165 [Parvibaculum sp.]|nr:hypothetical protein [Parvibaculum sp.]
MTNIRRIGSTELTLSTQSRESRARTHAPRAEIIAPVTQPRANAGLHIEQPQCRPAAGFLTQYIDQHFRWPRAPHRKDRQRQRATSAYLNADMLPDMLADVLRLHPIDKKI